MRCAYSAASRGMTRSTDPATAVMVSDFRMSRRVGMGGPCVSESSCVEISAYQIRPSRSSEDFRRNRGVPPGLFPCFPFTRHYRARLSYVIPAGLELSARLEAVPFPNPFLYGFS